MSDFLVQFAVSNLVVSAVLAGVAFAVHRRGRYPVLAHLLWVLVLAKLVTPPLLSLPLARLPGSTGAAIESAVPAGLTSGIASLDASIGALAGQAVTGLLVMWALGSVAVFGVSLLRIYRFDRLLRRTSREAPGWVRFMADDAARRLNLGSAPTVYLSSARLSPMTWWAGGRVRIVLPEGLVQEIESQQLAWVLAHELSHVKRKDHLVRWLEWLAVVSFWWNPVAWWARQNLRLDEEASCDALVLEHLGARPRSYARALLAVAEHLASPAIQPPAVATGIDGGGSLERRFKLLISSPQVRRAPRWLVVGVVGAVMVVMPLGIGGPANVDATPVGSFSAAPPSGLSGPEQAFLDQARQRSSDSVQPLGVPAADSEVATARVSAAVDVKKASKSKNAKSRKARRARKAKARRDARAQQARIRTRRDAAEAKAAAQLWKSSLPASAPTQAPPVSLAVRF